MSMQTTYYAGPQTEERTGSLLSLLTAGFTACRAVLRAWQAKQIMKRQLLSLSEAQLRDIGLSKNDVEARYPSLYSERAGWPLR